MKTLIARKELQTQMRASQFYITPPPSASAEKSKFTVERYSDRFAVAKDATMNLCWSRLPKELRPETAAEAARRKKRKAASAKPNLVKKRTARASEVEIIRSVLIIPRQSLGFFLFLFPLNVLITFFFSGRFEGFGRAGKKGGRRHQER